MPRPTMQAIIARLRALIGDPAGAEQTWTDDELQDLLDHSRTDVRYLRAVAMETVLSGGATVVLDAYAPSGLTDWEADAQLCGPDYQPLTPATADYAVGHWTFAASQDEPIHIIGKTYDIHLAASTALESWAARLAREYDFKSGDQTFARGAAADRLFAAARTMRRRARVAISA